MTGNSRYTLVFWWSLLGVWLLAHQLRAQPAEVGAVKPKQVIGFGRTEKDAKENAVKQAAGEVAALVHRRYPALANWQPSLTYVEENCVESSGIFEKVDLLDDNPIKGIKCTLTLKPPNLDSLANVARREMRVLRGDQRLRWSMWGLLLLIIGLAVLVVFIKIERHTAGRHTLWLRAAALTTVATAGVAWWWAKDLFFHAVG